MKVCQCDAPPGNAESFCPKVIATHALFVRVLTDRHTHQQTDETDFITSTADAGGASQ